MNPERVLVVPSKLLEGKIGHGFLPASYGLPDMFGQDQVTSMLRTAHEEDETHRALAAYILVGHHGWFYSYERAAGSDPRLQARRSIGFGGHANVTDKEDAGVGKWDIASVMMRAARREFAEEFDLRLYYQDTIRFEFLGIINDLTNKVGRTHLGFVYQVESPMTSLTYMMDANAKHGEWMSPAMLWLSHKAHEGWSKMLITESPVVPMPETTWRAR